MRAIERSLIDHASLVVERDEFIAANFAFSGSARVDQGSDRQETVRTLGDMYEITWERMAFVFGLLRCGQNVEQWIIVGRVAQDDDKTAAVWARSARRPARCSASAKSRSSCSPETNPLIAFTSSGASSKKYS